MSAMGDGPADLVDMDLYGLGVGEGHGERGADAARRTDGAKQIGALVGWLARAGCAPGPLTNQPVLLPDPGLVLEPALDRLALGDIGEMGSQDRR